MGLTRISNFVWTLSGDRRKGGAEQAAEKPLEAVILRSRRRRRIPVVAWFYKLPRFFASLRMTAWRGFSAACEAPPFLSSHAALRHPQIMKIRRR